MTSVWLFKPRSHGRKKDATRARNGAPLQGGRPVSTCPINRRLRLCARVGTQHLFVVSCRRSCVVSDASEFGGAASGGGAMRARAARAACRVACARAMLLCGRGCCCGGGVCAATLTVTGARGVEGARVAAAWCARWVLRSGEAGFLSKVRAVCARAPLFLCSRCR